MTKKILSIITIPIFLIGTMTTAAGAQLARRTPARDSANYQGLIRKNLALRKDLRALEEKYMSLEDERKVLILHIKDLQSTRNATSAVTQDLKRKIAALRVEMLKDPKMVKTIDGLNTKVRKALKEKGELERRVGILGKEKKKLFNELNVIRELYNKEKAAHEKRKAQAITDEKMAEANTKFAEELEAARLAFKKKEDALTAQLHQVKEAKASLENRGRGLERELREVTGQLEMAQADLAQKIQQLADADWHKVNELSSEMAADKEEWDNRIRGLEAEKGILKRRGQDLQKKLDEANLALSTESGVLTKKIEDVRREKEERVAKAQATFARKEEDLKNDISRVKAQREETLAANEELKKTLKDAEAALCRAQADLKENAGGREELSVGREVQKQLAREVREANAKARGLDEENKDLQYKLRKLKVARERSDDLLSKKIEEVRRDEQKRLALEREAFERKEAPLRKCIERIESERDGLKDEMMVNERSAMEAQKELLAQVKKMKAKNAALSDDLAREGKRISEEASERNKAIARLKVDLENAQTEKESLGEELAKGQRRLNELDGEVQWMQRERKKFNETLAQLTKQIDEQEREAKYDKQFLEQKVKNAKADKMMVEAKFETLKVRAETAEAKLIAAQGDLETREAQTSLQESEIMVLREAKSKLEQKLIRYIEKIIEDEDGRRGRAAGARGSPASTLPGGAKGKTKKEATEQKLKMHYNLALAYDRQGLYAREEKEYLKCLKINARDANVHYNLAILYDDKLNLNDKAVEHYKRFLSLRPAGLDVERVKEWMLHAEQEHRLGPEVK